MSWNAAVRSALLEQWSSLRLASAPGNRASMGWPDLVCPLSPDPGTSQVPAGRAFDPGVLSSVYGFGVFMGETFGRLLGVRAPARDRYAGLCGRFNLGISLFDFICDESDEQDFARMMRIPSLRSFSSLPPAGELPADGRLEYLDRVIASVLDDLATELGPPRPPTRAHPLWRILHVMFRAEILRARMRLEQDSPHKEVLQILQWSSAEPFRVMAQWMGRGAVATPEGMRRAATLGRWVGNCFWLIDDLKDVWEDLYAGRWNLLLLDARRQDPALSLKKPGPILERRLIDLWAQGGTVKHRCAWAMHGLARALDALPRHDARRDPQVARLQAALLAWYA